MICLDGGNESAPEEHNVYSLQLLNNPPRSSGAQCALVYSHYIPLLMERDNSVGEGYKHRAPPEQGPEQQKQEFSGKAR